MLPQLVAYVVVLANGRLVELLSQQGRIVLFAYGVTAHIITSLVTLKQ